MTQRNFGVCTSSSSVRYHGKLAEMARLILYFMGSRIVWGLINVQF